MFMVPGVAYTLTPTSVENRATGLKSIGLGLQVDSVDKYFFSKMEGKIRVLKELGNR